MKQPTVLFRALLVASIASALAGGVLDFLFPELIPQSLREAQEALSAPELTAQDIGLMVVGLPYLAAFVVCSVALYRFRRWAPRASLYLTIASVAVYPFAGFIVASEWSQLLTEASALFWGAMLAMAHLPPLKERFAAARVGCAEVRSASVE
ncbi:MAG: hypothetical protein ACREU9_06040 [Gammaproteobacteria bacterium]